MERPDSDSAAPLVEPLTRREREILALLDQGLTAPEIAEKLTLGLSSVKTHVQHIYAKLGANSKRQAVDRARELGWLPPAAPASTTTPTSIASPRPTPQHNLPLQLTSFIGRAYEIGAALRLLRASRLITVTGPGGSGKTRLALTVGTQALAGFADGVWLVELAPIADPALVPQTVAQALRLRAEGGQAFQDLLADHLRDKTLLLILDNCEHLAAACAQLAESLLKNAPGVRILATSTVPLEVGGESTLPVPSLSLPEALPAAPLESVATAEAVQLFVTRAAAVRPDFVLTPANAAAVAQICRRLDGIPLAIELAAARARALDVEQIAARLDDRFGLLAGSSRSAPPRQQTLRATLDWSHELLSEPERALLRRLSVFAGGWTLEAAEAVCGDKDEGGRTQHRQLLGDVKDEERLPDPFHPSAFILQPSAVLDLLAQLVARSLVLSEQRPGQETRFRMLESIQEYGLEKLAQAGEAAPVRDRHLGCYLALAEEAEPGLRGHGQLSWLRRLERENDNLRAALAWSLQTEAAEMAMRLASALFRFWTIRAYAAEASHWLEAAIALPASSGALAHSVWRAKALSGAGRLGWHAGLPDYGWSRLVESLAIYRELNDQTGMATALMYMGDRDDLSPDAATALRLFEEALELYTAARDRDGIGICQNTIAQVLELLGERAKALQLYQSSAANLRAQGDQWNLLWPSTQLAWNAWLDGNAARAQALLQEVLATREELGDKWGNYFPVQYLCEISMALGQFDEARAAARAIPNLRPSYTRLPAVSLIRLGQVDYMEGRLDDARDHLEASLKIFRDLNDRNGLGWAPPWLGCVAYRQGNLDEARALIEAGLALHDPGAPWHEVAFALFSLGEVTRAQGELAVSAAHYARSLRSVMAHGARPSVPAHLEGFAKLAAAAGDTARAARLWGAAEALRAQIGIPVPPVERTDYEQAVAAARQAGPPSEFAQAWSEGRAWTWKQAAEYALER